MSCTERKINLTKSNMILTIGGQLVLLFITGCALYFGIDELLPKEEIQQVIAEAKKASATAKATANASTTTNPLPTIATMPTITPANMTRPVAAAVAKVIANKK